MNWFLYVGVVVMRGHVPDNLYDHYIDLVYGVRLLLQSSAPLVVDEAEKHLTRFCRNIVDIFDNPKIETINVHNIKHFCHQVREFGPLYVFSAMSFESANRELSSVFTGTHSHCEVICRRFLQKQRLRNTHFDHDDLYDLLMECTGDEDARSHDTFMTKIKETEAIKRGRRRFPKATFLPISYVDGVF